LRVQEFASSWPGVLAEILEFIILTQLSVGRDRAAAITLTLSRERVAPEQLQPHVEGFRARLAQQLPTALVDVVAEHCALHRVQIAYGN